MIHYTNMIKTRGGIIDMVIWYLLYNGTSTDGRGIPVYCGRTTSEDEARRYLETTKTPYSFGKVDVVTDTSITRMI